MKVSKTSAAIQRKFVRNAQVLTNVMTPKGDIKVVVKGATAFTDHKRIVIPQGDFTDEGFVRLVKGLVDHECGHINFTEEGSMPKAHKRSKLTATFLNIFEDIRMEACVMKAFPGCEYNLLDTVKEAINRKWFAEPEANAKLVQLVQSYVLYRGRSEFLGQYPVALFAQVAEEQLAQSFGNEIFSKLSAIVDNIPTMNTSWDALLLANQVIDMLEDEQEEQENKGDDQEQSSDSSSSQPDDSDDDSSDADSDDDSAQSNDDSSDPSDGDENLDDQSSGSPSDNGDSDNSSPSNGDGSDSDDDTDSNDDDDSNDDGADSNDGDLTPEEKAKQIAEMLDADDDDLMKDFHELIQQALSDDSVQAQNEGRAAGYGEIQAVERFYVDGDLDKTEALAAGRSISPPLKRLLLDVNKHEVHYKKRGSQLANSKLTNVSVGNFSVFKHEKFSKSPNTAVSLLVDRSYSMMDNVGHGKKMIDVANECTYALSHTMEKLKGVSTEVNYYPFGESLHIAKSFNEKTASCSDRFEVSGGGGTPTGDAICTALRSIVLRPESKKILFVITDGEANDENCVRDAIEKAKACGVQVVGIGIGTGPLGGFEGAGFVSVDHVSQLHIAIKDIFQQSLIAA